MADERLRDLERRWLETGALDDEAALLAERVRAGELAPEVTVLAAYFGSKVAHLVHGDVNTPPDHLTPQSIQAALRLVFGNKTELPPRVLEFLEYIFDADREARATLNHFELVQKGDVPPPDSATVLKALMNDLKDNRNHREEIDQMECPVFQLIPIYEHEGAGFQRMINDIDAHRVAAIDTQVQDELRNRWGMNSGLSSKIVRWKVTVVEGGEHLPNRFLMGDDGNVRRVEDQLNQWQQYCQERGLQLCEKESFALLQIQAIRLASPGTLVSELGLDPEETTSLGDRTRQPGSFVPRGYWYDGFLSFEDNNDEDLDEYVRFRVSVVINIP